MVITNKAGRSIGAVDDANITFGSEGGFQTLRHTATNKVTHNKHFFGVGVFYNRGYFRLCRNRRSRSSRRARCFGRSLLLSGTLLLLSRLLLLWFRLGLTLAKQQIKDRSRSLLGGCIGNHQAKDR